MRGMLIHSHFHGIPGVPHGGYVAGLLANELGAAAAEVRLKKPVPSGRHLDVERASDGPVELREGESVLAVASEADVSLHPPARVTHAEAKAASARFPGFTSHPAPRCVVCGPDREDGLRVFPGAVPGRRMVAALWVPQVTGQEFAWAALDCPQLWALMVHSPADSPDAVVTAALEARVERPLTAGQPHVVMGWPIGRQGRKWLAGAAVFGPDGELCAIGRQTAAHAAWGIPLGRARWTANRAAA
jgi:hypothetical protein